MTIGCPLTYIFTSPGKPFKSWLNVPCLVTIGLPDVKQYHIKDQGHLLTSYDLIWPWIKKLCTTLKNHYIRNTMTTFQEHTTIFVGGDTVWRYSQNSHYWPLNDLWPQLNEHPLCPFTWWTLWPSFTFIGQSVSKQWQFEQLLTDR